MLVPVLIINQNASAFAGGDGSAGNPFQISNVTELQNMSANLSAHYVLMNDIDASATITWNWNGKNYTGFIPIANDTDPVIDGFQGKRFKGSLDGRGFNITGLFINRSKEQFIGLFGFVSSQAIIKNVNIINYCIFGDFCVGGLIGCNYGATVTNCTTSGTINIPGDHHSNTEDLGGLIGYNLGPVSNCLTRGDIYNSGHHAGGLIGESDANVTNCISYVNVSGEVNGGGYNAGLIGYNIYSAVTNCTTYGNIHGCYDIGGLLGDSWGPVRNCSTYGNVTGAIQYGGLIGMGGSLVENCRTYGNVTSNGLGGMEWASGGLIGSSSATVINCSTYGDIYGYQQVGGLLGLNDDDGIAINCSVYGNTMGINDSWAIGGLVGENEEGTVINCIVYGNANSTDSDSWDTGGLVGFNEDGKIENCISYANTSGYETVGGLIGGGYGKVVNCTAFGNVNGTGDYTGGLIGMNGGKVINCTTYGNMTAIGENVGGLIGDNAGNVKNCNVYGDIECVGSGGGLIGWNEGKVINCTTYGNMTATGPDVGGMIGWNDNAGTVLACNVYGDIDCIGSGGGLIGFNVGKVSNCSVYGVVNGTLYYIGGLIGENEGIVANCTSSKYVNGTEYLGGLAGFNDGVVSNCTAYSDLNGTHDLGGLIGYNIGTVTNCIAYGNINGTYGIGGLIGLMDNGAVTNCNAFGNVTSLYGYSGNVGGLIGAMNSGTATNCNAFGDVYGTYEPVGGLIGWSCGPVTNCNAYGEVSSTHVFVGGLIGENNDEVTNCNAYGNATGKIYVGGLLGASYWEVTNSTAYGNTTGNVYVGGLIGFNDWTVTNSQAHGTTSGNGSDSNAIGGLIGFNEKWGEAIDCTAYGNTTGNTSVGGIIGNNSGTVLNCTSYGNTSGNFNVGGVVGYNNGTVKNCTSFGNVTGTGSDYIGGLVGINNGTIIDSKASGNIIGDIAIGGLIGLNLKTGTVTNCTASGKVTGLSDVGGLIGNNSGTVGKCGSIGNSMGTGDYVGGLIGNNSGTLTNCYSHGSAVGDEFVGGLIGYTSGAVTNCYSAGHVTGNSNIGGLIGSSTGTITNCFWDNETSSLKTSAGGAGAQGRNTSEMMMQVTFTRAGWDFVNIWGLDEGKMYPFYVFWYNPPIINVSDVKIATEGTLYYVDYDAIYSTHVPGNAISGWKLTTNASSWLVIDSNGVLSGTPSNTDVGSYWVNVTVTDLYAGNDSHNFTLTVLDINYPPIITTIDIKSVIEDTLYSVDYEATDIDIPINKFTWTLATNATWLNIDSLTGVLSGTPVNDDVGIYFVNVSVDDNRGGMDFTNFSLTVINTNDAPVIITANVITATEDILYYLDYDATDVDPTMDTLTWTLETDAGWLSLNVVTGNLSGTPTNEDVGVYWVNVSVEDGNGGIHSTNFTLTVINVNDDPEIITDQIPKSATEDLLYSVAFDAVDIDPTEDDLIWYIATNADWLDMDGTTGVISGTPSNEDIDSYWVNISVDDGNGGVDFVFFTLNVINVNDPPIITTSDLEIAIEDEFYSVKYEGTDVDPTADTLTWTLASNANWLEINSLTGILQGTPSNDDVGEYWVNVTVNDGNGGSDWSKFTLTVNNVNDPPNISTDDVNIANVNELYSVDYNAIDIDPTNDTLTWLLTTNTSKWLTINPITGELSGTPTVEDIGNYWINVTVNDGNGGSDWHFFIMTVILIPITNQNPVINTLDIITAQVGELYSVKYQATDDRTAVENLDWSMETNATWLSFDPSTGILSGTPADSDVGTYWINISVDDREGGIAFTNFMLTVFKFKSENAIPNILDGKMSPEDGDTETVFTFSVTYADDDNDPGKVWLWLDGDKHQMEPDSNDTDYTDGVEYFYITKLEKGKHTFYFTADDGTAEAESGDAITPTSADDARSTPKISEPAIEGAGFKVWMLYLIIIIILIILMAIGIFVYKIKKNKEAQIFEDEKRLEGRQEIGEGIMGKEFQPPEGFEIESYELIKELKQEVLMPEETGELSLSSQEILERFEIKYSKGEISKATYDSIRESLITNEL